MLQFFSVFQPPLSCHLLMSLPAYVAVPSKKAKVGPKIATTVDGREGHLRRMCKDITALCDTLVGIPLNYFSHVARGKLQSHTMGKQFGRLHEKEHRPRSGTLTIDMKSRISKGKHLEQQGYSMGSGKGMSLQGGMLDYTTKEGEDRTLYVDIMYDQISNQAWSKLYAQTTPP